MAKTLDDLALRELLGVDEAAPARPATPYTARARYLSSLDGFNIKQPAIPAHVFRAERDRALDPATPTGLVPLDLSGALQLEGPATTPLILARYARIRAGETLETRFTASTELYYAIRGAGTSRFGDGEAIAWAAGDAFALPGGDRGAARRHGRRGAVGRDQRAGAGVRALRAAGAGGGADPPRPTTRPRTSAGASSASTWTRGAPAMPGKSVNLGHVDLERQRTTTPTFTLAMNSLLPGEAQRAHRHNAVAVLPGRGRHPLLLDDRRRARGLGAERGDDHPAHPAPLPPQRGRRPGPLPHRPGRRPLLPLPDDGLQLSLGVRPHNLTIFPGLGRQDCQDCRGLTPPSVGNQRVSLEEGSRTVSSRAGPVEMRQISQPISSSSQRT